MDKQQEEEEYPATTILEFIESSGISDSALVTDPPSKLSKIDDIPTKPTFIIHKSGYEPNYRQSPNHFASKSGDWIGVLNVSSDNPICAISTSDELGGIVDELMEG